MDTDAAGKRLAIDHFRDPDFSWEKFLHEYAPERWGRERPHGKLEEARKRSAAAQARHVIARVPSNTTIIGASPRAGIHFGGLAIDQGQNIIIRRLNFSQAYDHFPLWDPKDGQLGEWNSNYDNLSLRGAKGVWIDENHFTSLIDKEVPSSMLDRPVEHFDALLDITHRSDWITVSRNVFKSHRKGTLVGGSDRPFDQGTLRVTFHDNHWHDVGSRSPRIRYGLVHLYNNLYTISDDRAAFFEYSVGIGVKAQVLLQSNVWKAPPSIPLTKLIKAWGGEVMRSEDSRFNGKPIRIAEGRFDENLSWSPPYRYKIRDALEVDGRLSHQGSTTRN
jgi:pectate lyase